MTKSKLTQLIASQDSGAVEEEKAVVTNPTTDGEQELLQEYTQEIESQDGLDGVVNAFRRVKIGGSEFRLERRDPYGLWTVVPRHGTCPEALSGQYTNSTEAVKAIELYVNTKRRS